MGHRTASHKPAAKRLPAPRVNKNLEGHIEPEGARALRSLRGLYPLLANDPDLRREVATVLERAEATALALTPVRGSPDWLPDMQRGSPTGAHPQSNYYGLTWAGGSKDMPQGIPNAHALRRWVENDPWVAAAIIQRQQQVSRANIAVGPEDEQKRCDTRLQENLVGLLNYPNEREDSWRSLIGPVVGDILTLDRGCIEKDMDLARHPHHLYFLDGATIKIYPSWDGDPATPHYLFEDPATTRQQTLRNDEVIVITANDFSYRLGLSPVQILAETIESDIKATQLATKLVSGRPPARVIQVLGATEPALKKMRNDYEKTIAGQQEILFVGGNKPITSQSLVFSLADNQFMEWQLYLARKICAVFQISPQDIGIAFDINKATAQVQYQMTQDKGLVPLLLLIEQYLNRELLANFAKRDRDGRPMMAALNLRISFPEVTEIQRKLHVQELIDVAKTAMGSTTTPPIMPPNAVFKMMGQPPVVGGNTLYMMSATNGMIPWLSYDGVISEYGSFGTAGDLGAQDPAGGVDEDAAEPEPTGQGQGRGSSQAQTGPRVGDDTGGEGEIVQGDDTSGPTTGSTPAAPPAGEAGKALARRKDDTAAAHGDGEAFTGLMVGFFLDQATAEQIAVPGGEPVEDLHMTLAYLGDGSHRTYAEIQHLKQVVAAFAAQATPLAGRINGVGRFAAPPGEPTPFVALPDLPDLPAWRQSLVEQLTAVGFAPDAEHGYTPHITLAYIDAAEPMPFDTLPPLALHFTDLTLAIGEERITYALQSSPGADQAKQVRRARPKAAPPPAPTNPRLLPDRRQVRAPGQNWSPTLAAQALPLSQPLRIARAADGARPTPVRRVPDHIALTYAPPAGVRSTREFLEQQVRHILEAAQERGVAAGGG